jgi:hypothetical protein
VGEEDGDIMPRTHVLTDAEVADEFLIWDRARRLFPGLEESLEDVEFVLLRNHKVVSATAIGIEYKQSDILRYLTIEEVASCLINEYKSCFVASLLEAFVSDVEKGLISGYKGHRRHASKIPMQPAKYEQFGTI